MYARIHMGIPLTLYDVCIHKGASERGTLIATFRHQNSTVRTKQRVLLRSLHSSNVA